MQHSHVPKVFWDGDGDLVKGVSRRRAVGVQRPDALRCDNLVVCGVACCVFNHIELKIGRGRKNINEVQPNK